ncbi:MAG: riboflavin synthase [Gammaproteobacteria bacterium]
MFSGIIAATGTIADARAMNGDRRIVVVTDGIDAARMRTGDSIAVQGVCLTVNEARADGFAADVSRETLACTTLGDLGMDALVNLEPALALGEPLGGHLVSGHVDAVGRVLRRRDDARSTRFLFEAPRALAAFIARKGSICVDGVSLTVNDVEESRFEVNIIPHTLAVTSFGRLQEGSGVNLEVDLVARYIGRYLEARPA